MVTKTTPLTPKQQLAVIRQLIAAMGKDMTLDQVRDSLLAQMPKPARLVYTMTVAENGIAKLSVVNNGGDQKRPQMLVISDINAEVRQTVMLNATDTAVYTLDTLYGAVTAMIGKRLVATVTAGERPSLTATAVWDTRADFLNVTVTNSGGNMREEVGYKMQHGATTLQEGNIALAAGKSLELSVARHRIDGDNITVYLTGYPLLEMTVPPCQSPVLEITQVEWVSGGTQLLLTVKNTAVVNMPASVLCEVKRGDVVLQTEPLMLEAGQEYDVLLLASELKPGDSIVVTAEMLMTKEVTVPEVPPAVPVLKVEDLRWETGGQTFFITLKNIGDAMPMPVLCEVMQGGETLDSTERQMGTGDTAAIVIDGTKITASTLTITMGGLFSEEITLPERPKAEEAAPAAPAEPARFTFGAAEWVDGHLQLSVTNEGGTMSGVRYFVAQTPTVSVTGNFGQYWTMEAGETKTLVTGVPQPGEHMEILIGGDVLHALTVPPLPEAVASDAATPVEAENG